MAIDIPMESPENDSGTAGHRVAIPYADHSEALPMPLPEFNQFGDLPEGIYPASLAEVEASGPGQLSVWR
jgi:hypothetical protein